VDALEKLPVPLLEWFRDNARSLPWRDDPTPYHVWLSEIMLQQTRVAAVLDYYKRFLAEAPDVPALAALGEDRLMKLWQGLGYYSRARNLQRAAKVIMERYGGRFPSDYAGVRALPGVGDYTAGAICSIAFGQAVPAVDGNVLRVYARICGDGEDISTPRMKKKATQAVEAVIPLHAAGTFNQALMELGATVCLPNGAPLCGRCPAKSFCAALAQDRVAELPVKAPKRPRRVEERTVWLIFRENKVALRRRPSRGLLAGLWEFPHELGDGPLPAGWGIAAGQEEYAGQAKHIFTHIEWRMTLRSVEAETDALPSGWVWSDQAGLAHKYAVPNAFERALGLAAERLGTGAEAV
jgi:A/G-specific adenine glycosylase